MAKYMPERPFFVRFRLNLGLNNLEFVHKSISEVNSIRPDWIVAIEAIDSMRIDGFNAIRWIQCDSIATIRFDRFKSNGMDCRNGFVDKF